MKIEQRTADDRVTNRIEGSEMAIERASKRVTSSAQVTLSGENYSIVAGAMEMLSDEKRLFLSNGVEGYYARQ